MIVEHEFITTLDKDDALARAAQFLQHAGFRDSSRTNDTVEANNGKGRRKRTASKLAQHATVQFDRGKVQVAVGITRRRHKLKPMHRNLLLGVATGLDLYLAEQIPLDKAAAQWAIAEDTIRRRRRRSSIMAGIAIGLLVGLIVFLIVITAITMSR